MHTSKPAGPAVWRRLRRGASGLAELPARLWKVAWGPIIVIGVCALMLGWTVLGIRVSTGAWPRSDFSERCDRAVGLIARAGG